MNRLATTFIILTAGVSLLLAAESASTPVKENTGEGFYLGGGYGASLYDMTLAVSTYQLDSSASSSTFNAEDLNDNDTGYLFYVGYQINKIIGVEASYTDYGKFSKEKFNKTYSQTPKSIAVYANAGYIFLDGQLRPFGLLGLGYLQKNQSKDYDVFDVKENIATIHYGTGVDFYPTDLKGFGFRASITGDTATQGNYRANDENNASVTTSLWQSYGLFYIGAQYKF